VFGALTITVGTGAATTTTVSSNSNPTTLNGRPTLTATIGGAAPTTGTVSFYDNYTGTPVLLGQGTVGSAHTATFRLASGQAFWGGTHPITAVYSGIAADAGSTSAVFNQTVTKGTVTINLNPRLQGAVGQTFTFPAIITPSSSNATFAPNQGVATFYDCPTVTPLCSNAIGTATPGTITSSQGGYGLWTAVLSVNNLAAGVHYITATYSDLNFSLGTSSTQTVTVEGISWPTPSAITYGTFLSSTQLNATNTVPGTFVYSPPAGTQLSAGLQTLSVTFTPTDTVHYLTQTATVQMQVNKATLSATCGSGSFTQYGPVPAFPITISGVVPPAPAVTREGVHPDRPTGITSTCGLANGITSSSAPGDYPTGIVPTVLGIPVANYTLVIGYGDLTIHSAAPSRLPGRNK
jgi:hypothetical protein